MAPSQAPSGDRTPTLSCLRLTKEALHWGGSHPTPLPAGAAARACFGLGATQLRYHVVDGRGLPSHPVALGLPLRFRALDVEVEWRRAKPPPGIGLRRSFASG
jgi:hypothetical protein